MATKTSSRKPKKAKKLELEDLLAQHSRPIPRVGELVDGKVISATRREVYLDIEGYGTGVVRGKEVHDESGECNDLKPGDTVQATLLEQENENGMLELSFRYAGHLKAWGKLKELMRDRALVDAKVTDANRGGLIVKVGHVIGFLPVSQLTGEHYPRVDGGDKARILQHLKRYVGQTFPTRIIDVQEADEKLIVSEKAAQDQQQAELLGKYSTGQTVSGRVSGLVDFGAFVEFDEGLEGLVHISEIAWQRLDHPSDLLKMGETVQAKIIDINGSKISLSMKQLKPDPWQSAADRYHVGQIVEGKVLKLNPFGAFVELDEEIHGLCHVSELDAKPLRQADKAVLIGQRYPFQVISLDPTAHRLGLSRKALLSGDDDTATKPKRAKTGATEPAAEAVAAAVPSETPESPSPERSAPESQPADIP